MSVERMMAYLPSSVAEVSVFAFVFASAFVFVFDSAFVFVFVFVLIYARVVGC